VNQLRSISRDENGRPGHPRPALRARRASRAWHRGTWVARQAGRRRHAPCGQRCLCSYRGCPHWLARRHCVATCRSRRGS